jgi:hypothetical protein
MFVMQLGLLFMYFSIELDIAKRRMRRKEFAARVAGLLHLVATLYSLGTPTILFLGQEKQAVLGCCNFASCGHVLCCGGCEPPLQCNKTTNSSYTNTHWLKPHSTFHASSLREDMTGCAGNTLQRLEGASRSISTYLLFDMILVVRRAWVW